MQLTIFQMLSFEEQRGLINNIYDYEINEDTIKAYITRGSTEEQTYNKKYILSVFKNKQRLIDFSDGYTKLIKLYINLFLVNNEVYYLVDRGNRVYGLPTNITTTTATIYDALTNEPVIVYKQGSADELILYSRLNYSIDGRALSLISYNNLKKLKDFDNIVIEETYISTDRYKETPFLKTLTQVLKNDDIDMFTDICARNPECINDEYRYIVYTVRLFELTVLFNAIKCFKYMMMNNYYNTDKCYYHHLAQFVAVSNNLEIFRLLENKGFKIIKPSSIYNYIDYHRNDIIEYAFRKDTYVNKIGDCFRESITSYNYDLMLYILENYVHIPNNTMHYGSEHMSAILYALNTYNIGFSANWLNMIPALISLPFSVDAVITVLKKVPSYVGRADHDSPWVNIPKACLIACFQYKKSYEYINEIINFIYGSPKIEYNHMNWYRFCNNRWTYFTPLTVLNSLYEKQIDVDIIMFIKVMFYKGYEYNNYDLKMIALLMRRKTNEKNLKKLSILMQYYTKQFENHWNERMME